MGGLCSKRSAVDKSPSDSTLNVDYLGDHDPSSDNSRVKIKSESVALPAGENKDKWLPQPPLSFSDRLMSTFEQNPDDAVDLQAPQISRVHSQKFMLTKSKPAASAKTGTIKVAEVSSILGRAGTVGFGKAVEVLDNFGSSMTSLNLSSSFVPGSTTKGGKIFILSFEVANTIVKGANLLQSLSEENIKHLKEVLLPSEGVQLLVSKDMDELLRTAASDKREELKVFSGEVVRFGNRCKDPQWHNLDRYFEKLGSERTFQPQLKQDVDVVMKHLMTMAQCTAELYHELHSLDRFEQDYKRKLQEEENFTAAQRGDSLQILRQELKSQKKHVKSLMKKSLWSRILEEVIEKLVDVVDFLNLEIHNAFDGDKPVKGSIASNRRLGSAGLALHYANIITQIDTLVSRSSSVPPNMRDTLYQGLPPSIKNALRAKLHSLQVEEEITVEQIKAEMDKTLRWLVPIANNTTKAHHGFGWVGEWANTGTDLNRKPGGQADLIKIQTLHHADKVKTESYILELIVLLHQLIIHSKPENGGLRSPIKSPIRSPTKRSLTITLPESISTTSTLLSKEDQEMLRYVNFRKLIPGISKSQEFDTNRSKPDKHSRLSKSNSHSPTTASKKDFYPLRRPSLLPVIDFNIDKMKALDLIDRVDTLRKL
ncbi:uncharacterized protein LOC110102891 isoform X2 [Dendrobium catenatum]|uniref:uncharacterized protein LOC110102891 isoform X2 n=1 Tax=Dendrobium catenatum TaxID=906689 RepID=UPI00109FD318|nr:uncharacterized protein LOC110102891 isoform X2 [Dendrobium catenatum]